MPTPENNNLISQKIVARADRLYQSGQCDPAVDLLLAAIKKNAGEKNLYYTLAQILIDSEQFKDAMAILDKMPLDEGDLKRLGLSAYCQLRLERYEEARSIADRMLGAREASAPALNLKGVLAYKQADKNTAADFFKKAITIDPNYGEAYANLGTIAWEDAKYTEALDLFEKGFIQAPLVKETVFAYHNAVKAQNAYERAEQIFQSVVKLCPLNKRLIYLLIEILLQQSKYEAVMEKIETAIALFGIEDGILAPARKIRAKLGPLEIDANSDRKGSVSLCMIARNEANILAKCLRSIKPVVDEMIVVDTGSSDATRDIAEVFGAKVFEYPWDEDFSKARNYSLSKAHGDWIFILDADEVISGLDYERFHALVGNGVNGSAAYSITTRNYTMQANTIGWVPNDGNYIQEEAGGGWFPSEKVRLFKNDTRIQFEYAVHEMVDPGLTKLGIAIRKCSIPVHHYGKLNAKTSGRKTETYYNIGRKKRAEIGDNFAVLRELAIQAGHLEKHEEAIELWQHFIELQPEEPEAFVNMGTAFWHLSKYDQALLAAKTAVALAPGMKEAYFNYAISELHLGNAHKAIVALEKVLAGNPGFMAAEFMLSAAYCCDGNKEKGLAGFEKIRRTAVGPVLAVTFDDLATRLAAANQSGYAISLLEAAIEGGSGNEQLIRLLENYRQAG